ncbi:Na/Pi cotransporter family protein [Velocimicrobium porci]|uniref:Na/Pi cotransporter family protein n=1 Tax=Velocimicrobium porci TaxID=2606634 RepID=A0A6L5XWX8_9FIRM|nr:Na/Pi cotransporter family protein [Velocimicrobium porci]MSS63336.1 Na/Pi cotransporter family protein [Velocimicrobium porci]
MGMNVILGLVSGLGLFLYGMKLMGDGLQKVAGAKLRTILETLTKNRFIGMLVGLLFTAVIQSSSAATVLVVSFVDAGLMRLGEAAGVIMGANIGTTMTGQLIAFNLTAIAPLFLMTGVIMVMFVKKPFVKKLGEVILGFGMLFVGMSTMSSSLSEVKNSAFVVGTMSSLTSPVLALLVGMLVTAVLQSSSATVGIIILLASQGLLELPICFYLILGCNIGACVSAGLASLSGKKMAKRAALIHLLFNIIGTFLFVIILAFAKDGVYHLIHSLTAGIADPGTRIARDVANTHTLFKVAQVIMLLPFSDWIIKLTYFFVPGHDEQPATRHLEYIGEHLVYSPTAAIPQAICELQRMGRIAIGNLKDSVEALLTKNEEILEKVYETEGTIDYMNTEIVNYLLKVNQLSLPVADRKLMGSLFHVVSDIERIGDHAQNIADYTRTMIGEKLHFTEDAKEEFIRMFRVTVRLLDDSMEMFSKRNEEYLQEILSLEEEVDELEHKLQRHHVRRMTEGVCNPYAGTIFSDLCSNLERVADHGTNIAFSILETDPEEERKSEEEMHIIETIAKE